MKKRLAKKVEKSNVAYYMGAVIQSIAFCWTGFEVDPDDSDDIVKAFVVGDFDRVRELANYYGTTYTTDEVVKGEIRHYDMAIPPHDLVDAFKRCVYKENGVYNIYPSDTMFRAYARYYHDIFGKMLELAEYDDEDE